MCSSPLATSFSIVCVIFLIILIRTRLSIPFNHEEYANKGSGNVKILDKNILKSCKGLQCYNGLRTHYSINWKESKNIPGYDHTEEQMRKLKLWDKGEIPYYIDVPSFADKVLRNRIRGFLNKVNSETRLNFVELPRPPKDCNNLRWVFFINRRSLLGCADHCIRNFSTTGPQRVVLGYDCIINEAGLADTVLAIAGIPPQHNAPNRDGFITVKKENILPEKLYLFQKFEEDEWLFHSIPYDFDSVGHFHNYRHTYNGHATFENKVPYDDTHFGTMQEGFSQKDLLKIGLLYNYIATNQRSNIPECDKLFFPRKIRGNEYLKLVKPRPKLNKDQSNNKSEEDYGNSFYDSTNNNRNFTERESNKEIVQRYNEKSRINDKSEKHKKPYKDPLTYISDYTSSEFDKRR